MGVTFVLNDGKKLIIRRGQISVHAPQDGGSRIVKILLLLSRSASLALAVAIKEEAAPK